MSKPNPQSNSLLANLPREVREAIYLEVWRTAGLRQHIVAHWGAPDSGDAKAHYCKWACCVSEFEVQDGLQEEIDHYRVLKKMSLGEWGLSSLYYQGLLSSPWDNHHRCGNQIEQEHGREYIEAPMGLHRGHFVSTAGRCWKDIKRDPKVRPLRGVPAPTPQVVQRGRWKRLLNKVKEATSSTNPKPTYAGSPYMPMLLSCKLLSPEILESLYKSTTFIFTDLRTWQLWLGFCEPHPEMAEWPEMGGAPRGFLCHTRDVELSVSPLFSCEVPCTAPELSSHPETLHDPHDFHWLKMDRFQNLRSVKIWISARCLSGFPGQSAYRLSHHRIDEFDIDELKKALSSFDGLDEFVVSTPLGAHIEPEDGYVQNVMEQPNHHIWKRGTGDHYHPAMDIDLGMGGPIARVENSVERTVNPAITQLTFSYSFRLTALL